MRGTNDNGGVEIASIVADKSPRNMLFTIDSDIHSNKTYGSDILKELYTNGERLTRVLTTTGSW